MKNNLTFEEATELSMKTKWKISMCGSGETCWCRMIEPEIAIVDKDDNEICIANSGCIAKDHAEYIVKLHNDSLSK